VKYHFEIRKEENGYTAGCIELKGCRTEADSFDKLLENMREALDLYLDEPMESDMVFPPSNASIKGKGIVEIPVSPNIALALTLRNIRKKHRMTQKETADAMGFKGLFSYQRLESSKTSNPGLATLDKIKSVFPEIDFDSIIQGTSRNNTLVIPIAKGWGLVVERDYQHSGIYKTQEAAIKAARSFSKNLSSELTIQGKDGKMKTEKSDKEKANAKKSSCARPK
jgi:predicted RNase H-like HicB family nuclease/transcriptional regulator with XRE-family HTH domain